MNVRNALFKLQLQTAISFGENRQIVSEQHRVRNCPLLRCGNTSDVFVGQNCILIERDIKSLSPDYIL